MDQIRAFMKDCDGENPEIKANSPGKRKLVCRPETANRILVYQTKIEIDGIEAEIGLTDVELQKALEFGSVEVFMEILKKRVEAKMALFGKDAQSRKVAFLKFLNESAERANQSRQVDEIKISPTFDAFLRIQVKELLKNSHRVPEHDFGELPSYNEYLFWAKELSLENTLDENEYNLSFTTSDNPAKRLAHIKRFRFKSGDSIVHMNAHDQSRIFKIIDFTPDCRLLLERPKEPVNPMDYKIKTIQAVEPKVKSEKVRVNIAVNRTTVKPREKYVIGIPKNIERHPASFGDYRIWAKKEGFKDPINSIEFYKPDKIGGNTPEERFLEIQKKDLKPEKMVIDDEGNECKIRTITSACMIRIYGSKRSINPKSIKNLTDPEKNDEKP